MKTLREEIVKTHHNSFEDNLELCEGCKQLLSLFTQEMKRIIGEQEKLSPVGFNTERETYRNALRTEQLKRVREVR